ncbi:MAG: hypothetical protein IJ533_10080 [Prevotella sp.]|nr:hypothetical protein [Prevotella sp.]MBQ8487979.1 hypothetical protein [Prevotella sp.]
MKKLFTLLALLLCTVVGVKAQGEVFTYTLNGGKATSNPSDYFSYDSGGKFSFNAKFTGAEYDGVSYSNGLKMEGTTKILFTSTAKSDVIIVQSTWSEKTIKFDGEELAVADAEAATGCRVYTISDVEAGEHSVTRGDGESGLFLIKVTYTEANTAPELKTSLKQVILKLVPKELEKSETFTVTGKNLTDGNYYPTLPKVDGLSLSPAYFTVSGGEVNQEFTITYASDVDVAEGKDAISATVDGKTIEIVVNYSCRATAYKQSVVSEAATWDWSKLTETVELTDDDPDKGTVATSPAKSEEFLLAEIDDRINFVKEFGDATAVKMEGMQYPSRGGYAQGKTIKFTTSVPGTFTVEYSNTGKDNSNRWLTINGTQFGDEAVGTTMISATSPVVNAGEVVISTTESYLRFKTITFTPSDAPATVAGDVNGDGDVNITDVTLTIDYVLGKNPADFNEKAADVNNDTIVNVTDVTTIIDIVLGK